MFVPPSLVLGICLKQKQCRANSPDSFFLVTTLWIWPSPTVYIQMWWPPSPPLYPFLLAARWNRMRLAKRVGDIHKSKSIPWFLAFWQSNHVVPWGVLIYAEREGDSQQTYVLLQRNSHEHLWVAHFAHDGPLGKSSHSYFGGWKLLPIPEIGLSFRPGIRTEPALRRCSTSAGKNMEGRSTQIWGMGSEIII